MESEEKQQFAQLILNTDKTKQQMQQYKIIKEELRERTEKGQSYLKIKYFKGEPRIIKSMMTMLHQNMQCLNNKIDELTIFIDDLEDKPDIICLTEHWLKHESDTN